MMVEAETGMRTRMWASGHTSPSPGLRGVGSRFGCEEVWLRYSVELPFVLRNVSVVVESGALIGVVGHNGAGKSSLLKVLAGVVRPSRGHVHIDGHAAEGSGARSMVERGVACVYQELSTVPTMSVRENLLLGFVERGPLVRSPKLARRRVGELVERCGLEDLDIDERVDRLGFGDRQRVEIARAVASEARFLLLDEPTAGLRGHSRVKLFSLLRSLQEAGIGLLMVNHHIDEVLELCQRVMVLRDGEVVANIEADAVREEEVAALMVGHEVEARRQVPAHEAHNELPLAGGPESAGAPSDSRVGRASSGGTAKVEHAASLRCSDLSAGVLRNVELELDGGRVHGFYGLEGAGQADLLRALVGSIPRRSGRVDLDGRELRVRNPRSALRQGIVYISGDRAEMVVGSMTGTDNVFVGEVGQRRLLSWVPGPGQRERQVRPLLEELQVRGKWEEAVLSLSGGNQQKVVVSRALLLRPRVLLLDEPTLGVDIEARATILTMVRQLSKTEGAIVCLASTDEQEILDICDDVRIFVNGRIVSSLEITEQVTKFELRDAAMGGVR